jgi:hypothetical protein
MTKLFNAEEAEDAEKNPFRTKLFNAEEAEEAEKKPVSRFRFRVSRG